jgi:hydrogenase-1 operon protein HyaF
MKVDAASLCYSGLRTGMARAVFNEVADRLQILAAEERTSAIDLRSLPLTEADLAELEELMGRGEVSANLEVIGLTEIWETAYAGAWWIRHMGSGGKVASEQIAITPSPEILGSQAQDIAAAAERIRLELEIEGREMPEKEASHG